MEVPFFSRIDSGIPAPKKEPFGRLIHTDYRDDYQYSYEEHECPQHTFDFYRRCDSTKHSATGTVGLYAVTCPNCGVRTLIHLEDQVLVQLLASELTVDDTVANNLSVEGL
jgi:hypothetical protein